MTKAKTKESRKRRDRSKDVPTWSITKIKHPKYPEYTVRVGEYEKGGVLQVFRMVDKKQTANTLKCRRCDLGSTPKLQEQEARRMACAWIEGLANPTSVVGPSGTAGESLTIGALIDRYALDGFAKTAPSYKKGLGRPRRVKSEDGPYAVEREGRERA